MLIPSILAVLAAAPQHIAVMPPTGEGITSESARAITDAVQAALAERHWKSVAVAAAVDAPVLQELQNCGNQGACYAAVAAALQADAVLLTSARKTSDGLRLEFTLLGVASGQVDGKAVGSGRGPDPTENAARNATNALTIQLDAPAAPETPSVKKRGVAFWAPLIAGIAVTAAGVYMTTYGEIDRNNTINRYLGSVDPDPVLVARANTDLVTRNVGIGGMCLGVAAIILAIVVDRTPNPVIKPHLVPSALDPKPD